MPAFATFYDNDADYVTPLDILAELSGDDKQLAANLRETHGLCDEHGDVASASLLQNSVDEAERRTWLNYIGACDLNHTARSRNDSESEAVQFCNRGYQVQAKTQA
jgi:hypothetical protein